MIFNKIAITSNHKQVATRLVASTSQSPIKESIYTTTEIFPLPLLCLPDNNITKYQGIKVKTNI